MQNQEASGANVEVILLFIDVESEQEFYCTQIEAESKNQDMEIYCQPCVEEVEDIKVSQGEATSVAVVQELSNTTKVEAEERKIKMDDIILLSKLPKVAMRNS